MIVQAFWQGPIGIMELMCIRSYLRHGHEFHLYTYDPIPWEMAGLKVCDATEIAPQSKLGLFPWTSIFSDYFRYALLAAKGGWWVDMDTLCLRPLPKWGDDSYVFARDNISHYYISGFVMHVPPAAPIVTEAVRWIDGLSPDERSKLGHMDIGPYLLQREVPRLGLSSSVALPLDFDPIPWDRITKIVDPAYTADLTEACSASYLIHLRQSIWNEGPNSSAGILPSGRKLSTTDTYPAESLWERLKLDLA